MEMCSKNISGFPGGGGGDLVSTMPGCVCRKVKDMGPFEASNKLNESENFIQNGCKICYSILNGQNFIATLYTIRGEDKPN